MAWRFRRSFKILPGVKFNLGKKSVGVTYGGKLFRVTKNSAGRTTVGTSVPGTGLYYSKALNGENTRSSGATTPRTTKWKTVAVVGAALALIGCTATLGNRQSEPEAAPAVRSVMLQDDQPTAAENVAPAVLDHGLQSRFDEIIDGAAVSATDNKATIETAFSSEEPPENVEEIKNALIAATTERYNGKPVSVSVASADGTILLTVANGRIAYDLYEKQAQAAAAAEQPQQNDDDAEIVYISSNGKIHNDPACSGMKSYRTMTLGDATSQGYSFCNKCW